MLKTILLSFILLTTLLAKDARLNHYRDAVKWEKDANTNADTAFNLGVLYHKNIKDYDKAVYWYKKAYGMKGQEASISASSNLGYLYKYQKKYDLALKWYTIAMKKNDRDATFNLGLLYKNKLKDYPNAIKYYTKAYKMGEMGGALNLAHLYESILKQPEKAMIWYKKAAKGGYVDAIKDLAHIAHEKNNNIEGGAYFIALINIKYSKQKVIKFLKNKWKLTDKELQKAYKLQLKLDIPKHYRGGI
ncbi:tetratricopeptide repeat protein [Sulfurimonas sp.]|uniref:tetratricopeptide repeat protein n=1 Tax=Sulfurimonas sp. TaxID=2022749 RepID=UPI002B489E27|nr:tetratricopeptide repeat protein [Sulfurimonas sp.]